jgi:hypothetical protein
VRFERALAQITHDISKIISFINEASNQGSRVSNVNTFGTNRR